MIAVFSCKHLGSVQTNKNMYPWHFHWMAKTQFFWENTSQWDCFKKKIENSRDGRLILVRVRPYEYCGWRKTSDKTKLKNLILSKEKSDKNATQGHHTSPIRSSYRVLSILTPRVQCSYICYNGFFDWMMSGTNTIGWMTYNVRWLAGWRAGWRGWRTFTIILSLRCRHHGCW